MKPLKHIECYVRIDGFVLRVEREGDKLQLAYADEHDRNEMLRYFASALHNPELLSNLQQFQSERSTSVLWYYPLQPGEFHQLNLNVEFARVRSDYEHTRQTQLDEPIWTYKFVPTMQLSTFMAHSTVLRLLEVAKAVSEGHTTFPAGVEEYSEDEWAIQFDQVLQKGLMLPSLLNALEQTARRYAELFEHKGRFYTPSEAEFWREELFKALEKANLINCEIPPQIFEQLKQYPSLSRCVNAAEYFAVFMDCHEQSIKVQDSPLSLDWMMFDPEPPGFEIMDDTEFREHCLEVFIQTRPQYPYTLPTEIEGKQYRLIAGWDNGRIKLLNALEIDPSQGDWAVFEQVYQPTYLELVRWASVEQNGSPAMEWDVVVDWDDQIEILADLGSDPTLPEAEYLLHCLYCHLSGLRGRDPNGLTAWADSLARHPAASIQRLAQRCRALASGELEFVYNDWCSGGFNRRDRAEAQSNAKKKRPK